MSLFCKNLTPLQRQSMRLIGVAMILTVCFNFLVPNAANPLMDLFPALKSLLGAPGHVEKWQVFALSALTLFPVLMAVFVGARYLAHEPDEFIRALITRALLWGIAWTMAADALIGALMTTTGEPFPIILLNADVLLISTMMSFRLLMRRYSR
jgi:hypothetical protein